MSLQPYGVTFCVTRLYTILLNYTMSSVIDKFKQELENTDVVEYIKSTENVNAEKINEMYSRKHVLHSILNMMTKFSISESIWNKLNHEEIAEMAKSFDANVVDFKTEIDELCHEIQRWEDWADRRPY